uniref:Uncharacterized protein n=1 Tax=Mus spicilegus TaxID=10103 RepID=A0A8C6HLH9_MUSSI
SGLVLSSSVSDPTVVLGDKLKSSNMSNKLEKGKSGNKVGWSSDTIDNEHCCFVHEKQRAFGESSSESEKEDEDNGDVLCAWGHQKGRHSDLSSNLVNTSSSKPQDPSKSLPSSIID